MPFLRSFRGPAGLALTSAALCLSLLGCANDPPAPSPEPLAPTAESKATDKPATAKTPLDKTKFGSEITETTVTPLTKLVGEADAYADKVVRTEGVVTSVCQSKGCWMQLSDAQGVAHVKFAGYGFFVPKNASGHRAVVQGKVLRSQVDECSGKDGCREKGEKESGQVAKLDFEATGVEFID
jgi:hypothetical protein